MVTVAILQGQKKKTPAAQAVPGCPALAGANAPTSAVTEHGDAEAPGAAVAGFIHGQSGAKGLILPPLPPGWFPMPEPSPAGCLSSPGRPPPPSPASFPRPGCAQPPAQEPSANLEGMVVELCSISHSPGLPQEERGGSAAARGRPWPHHCPAPCPHPGQAAAPLPLAGVAAGSPVRRAYPEILPRGEGPTPACSEPRAVLVMATQCF